MKATTEYKSGSVETVFFINTFAKSNQPFMEVKHGDDLIGCIYREWDATSQSEKFHARDFNGNPIFENENNIDSLETNFIINAEAMSREMIYGFRIAPVEAISERESEIRRIRNNRNSFNKINEINR